MMLPNLEKKQEALNLFVDTQDSCVSINCKILKVVEIIKDQILYRYMSKNIYFP